MTEGRRLRATSADGWKTVEEVVTEHLDALYRTALRMNRGHTANAEDLLQDAMLRACQSYHELREPDAARAWLFTILMRTHFNRQRATKRRPELLASDLSDAEFEEALAAWPSDVPTHSADPWPSADEVGEAIDALEEPLRAVVVLADVQGFRQREVARMLGLAEGTVASRLFRARRLLRDALRSSSPVSRQHRGLA